MKNLKTIIILILTIVGTIVLGKLIYNNFFRSPEDKLLNAAIENLKKSMNNPSSFESISFEEDLIKENQYIIEMNALQLGKYNNNYKFFKLTFRGDNKAGSSIIDEVYVKASPDNNLQFLGIEEIK